MKLMNLSNIKQGELVVADILFSEQVGAKRRLALVISNSAFNSVSEDIVVLKVTSHGSNTEFDVKLSNDNTILKNLRKESTAMVDFPTTILKQRIISRADRVKPEKLNEIKQKMKQLYAL